MIDFSKGVRGPARQAAQEILMYKIPTIGELVKDNKKVFFSFFRDGELWYKVEGTNFEFPITGDDLKGAIFKNEDKAILFMRWINKHIKYLNDSLEEANAQHNK
jgi:hypothetical protein